MIELNLTFRDFVSDPNIISHRLHSTNITIARAGEKTNEISGATYRHNAVIINFITEDAGILDPYIGNLVGLCGGWDNIESIIKDYSVNTIEFDIIIRGKHRDILNFYISNETIQRVANLPASLGCSIELE